ncbi:MAG: hypothetical protein KDH84_02745, partial [Calditrichaeota bacterium]|nr:hypothetical protein [Calditrichota bacterium]
MLDNDAFVELSNVSGAVIASRVLCGAAISCESLPMSLQMGAPRRRLLRHKTPRNDSMNYVFNFS